MKKHAKHRILAALLSIGMLLSLLPTAALAEETYKAQAATADDLVNALADKTKSTIQLTADITIDSILRVTRDKVVIDLNGHSITRTVTDAGEDDWNYAIAINGGDLVLTDNSTEKTGRISLDTNAGTAVAVQIYNGNLTMWGGTIHAESADTVIGVQVFGYNQHKAFFTMTGGTIDVGATESTGNSYGVYVSGGSSQNETAEFAMAGGTIRATARIAETTPDGVIVSGVDGDARGVFVGGAEGSDGSVTTGSFWMKGGKIDSAGFGICGDDDFNGTYIGVSNAVVDGHTMAIYHPQVGEMNISSSTLTGTSGLEAKGGTITLTDTTVTVTAEDGTEGRVYDDSQNHGNSTKGYAVAVVNNANYKTDGVSVTLDGGTYNARVSVLDDAQPDTAEGHSYKITIKGGTYRDLVTRYGYDPEHENGPDSTVTPVSNDSIEISGPASFLTNPSANVADGYETVKLNSSHYEVVAASDVKEVAATAATCTSAGNTAYYLVGETPCYKWVKETPAYYVSYPGTEYVIPALGHDWNSGTVTKEPGEAEQGTMTYSCKRTGCSETKEEAIEPKGVHHDESETGTLVGHEAVAASCVTETDGMQAYWTCSECKKDFVKGSNGGFVEVEDLSTLTIPWTHGELQTKKGIEATCTSAGKTDGSTCTICGRTVKQQEDIPVQAHTPGEAVMVTGTAPTCTEGGFSYRIVTCTVCRETLSKEKVAMDALGHELEKHAYKAADYSSDGNEEYYSCKNCDLFFSDAAGSTQIAKDSWVIAKLTRSSSSGSRSTKYSITVDEAAHGSASVSAGSASRGTTVTVTAAPDQGYTLETITVLDRNGKELDLGIVTLGEKYTFRMPAGAVTVKVTFMEDNTILNYFVDIPIDSYYYPSVLWAAENGITTGTDDSHFNPDALCTRAQIVTFLWRTAGCPEAKSLSSFTDVSSGSYYAKAVAWAVEQGITKGTTDTTFSPDATCTRAQAVTFLYRSEQANGNGMQGAWMLQNPFTDVNAESYYAEPVLWAVANSVTKGTTDTTFSPSSGCTRAQIVTFLYRASNQ